MDARSTVTLLTGARMPVLGLGTWQLTRDTADTVARAFELGYRMVDTASDYGTQPAIGAGLRRSAVPREDVYIVAKVEETDAALQATRACVAELGLEYVDLMLIHRPPPGGAGVELWEGLIRARQDGLARDIGVSNYAIGQMQALLRATGERPVVNQIEWSPLGRSERMLEYCRDQRIVIQAYSPLTHGRRLDDPALTAMARRYGKSPAQLLIRWNLQSGTVPLPKANRIEHLAENIDVFDFHIEEEDMARLDALNERYSALGLLPYD